MLNDLFYLTGKNITEIIYLKFRSYTGKQYDRSGFYCNDCLLSKKS